MKRIDAHAHYAFAAHLDELLAFLDEFELNLLNVEVYYPNRGAGATSGMASYRQMHRLHPHRLAWVTSFAVPGAGDARSVDAIITQLDHDFAAGAVGVKVWRNIGMEFRKSDGSYLMMDDPLFTPIYQHIARCNKTLLVHIAEPAFRWPEIAQASQPIGLYRQPPKRSLLGAHEGVTPGAAIVFPGYREQIAARDRVLERFPDLRMVGAHLGSLEHDLREVARRLDRYPNFAVDTSGRRVDLALQDRSAVREFFSQYKDRILWGMDQGTVLGPIVEATPQADRRRCDQINRDGYRFEFGLYESDEEVQVDQCRTRGLALPAEVLRAFYWENAVRWYPGIFAL